MSKTDKLFQELFAEEMQTRAKKLAEKYGPVKTEIMTHGAKIVTSLSVLRVFFDADLSNAPRQVQEYRAAEAQRMIGQVMTQVHQLVSMAAVDEAKLVESEDVPALAAAVSQDVRDLFDYGIEAVMKLYDTVAARPDLMKEISDEMAAKASIRKVQP